MKKLLAIALLALTTACAQTETSGMNSGMMCEKCPCCQKMMEGKDGMKMDGMKSGMQCPMMQGKSKDGMKCGCCQGMMGDRMTEKQSTPAPKKPAGVSAEEHKQHHPAQ